MQDWPVSKMIIKEKYHDESEGCQSCQAYTCRQTVWRGHGFARLTAASGPQRVSRGSQNTLYESALRVIDLDEGWRRERVREDHEAVPRRL